MLRHSAFKADSLPLATSNLAALIHDLLLIPPHTYACMHAHTHMVISPLNEKDGQKKKCPYTALGGGFD